jgi:hypothetical protein
MIHLIALDIDGTLLDSHGSIPQANLHAIGRAQELGIEIVLATGRRYDFARAIFEALPGPLTLILSNGAIVKTKEGRTLMRSLLPRGVARQVLASTREHREGAAVIFDRPLEGQVVFESVDWEHPRHSPFLHANRRFISEVRPLEDALTEDPVQVMFTGRCAAMRALFERLNGASPYSAALTEYQHRDFSLVDVVRAGCSKGATLKAWSARRGLHREEVMAIGDNLNDLEMLEYAGVPILMENSLQELKDRGWRVTASNDAAGVAQAIETLVLGEAS